MSETKTILPSQFRREVRDEVLKALDGVAISSGLGLRDGADDGDLPALFGALDAHTDVLLARAGWTNEAKLLPHTYVDASDDRSAYEADLCDRQAVTVAYASEHLAAEEVYMLREQDLTHGMDGWRIVAGIDALADDDGFILQWGTTSEKVVPGSFRVFVARSTLRKLGLPEGEPGGPPDFKTKPERV